MTDNVASFRSSAAFVAIEETSGQREGGERRLSKIGPQSQLGVNSCAFRGTHIAQ